MIVCFPALTNMCLPVVFAAQRRHLERRESEPFKAAKSQQGILPTRWAADPVRSGGDMGIAPINGQK